MNNNTGLSHCLVKLIDKLATIVCLDSGNREKSNFDEFIKKISGSKRGMIFGGIGKGKFRDNINSDNNISFDFMFKPNSGINLKKITRRFDLIAKNSLFIFTLCLSFLTICFALLSKYKN